MLLIHNGVVRSWSRQGHRPVSALEVKVDQQLIQTLREEYLQKPGIYEIIVDAHSGRFQPGDDILFIIVARDLRNISNLPSLSCLTGSSPKQSASGKSRFYKWNKEVIPVNRTDIAYGMFTEILCLDHQDQMTRVFSYGMAVHVVCHFR